MRIKRRYRVLFILIAMHHFYLIVILYYFKFILACFRVPIVIRTLSIFPLLVVKVLSCVPQLRVERITPSSIKPKVTKYNAPFLINKMVTGKLK